MSTINRKEPDMTNRAALPEICPARKYPDLDEICSLEDVLALCVVLGHPDAAPFCAAADLPWAFRQIERAGVTPEALAQRCGVPVGVIRRFAEGGYASEAETPSGLVHGLRDILEHPLLEMGPLIATARDLRIKWHIRDTAHFTGSISEKIQINCSSDRSNASANEMPCFADSQNLKASEPS